MEYQKELDVDQILTHIGEFGKFQVILEIMLCISILPMTIQVLLPYFVQYNPSWRCALNSTVCKLSGDISSFHDRYKDRCEWSRAEWEFTQPTDYSVVTQFDIYCGSEYLTYLPTSMTFIGWAIGAVVLGWLADRFGRWKILLPSQIMVILIGFLSAFSPNMAWYTTARFIIGFFIPGVAVQTFILASELVGPKRRPLAGIGLWAFFGFGLVILGVKAYFIRKWKTLAIVCTAPYVVVVLFFKFIPESIRWLRIQGRLDDATEILRKVAKMNKKDFPAVKLAPVTERGTTLKASPLDIWRPRKMALKTLIQGYAWMVNGLVYYGVALAADDLGGNMYRDYILASLVEFPAVVAAIYLCNKIGRKKTVAFPMFIGSIACVVVSLIPSNSYQHWKILRVILGILGKFCIVMSFDSIYTWSVELYPTVVRAQGMGFLQITARIGSALAPWVAKWLKVVHTILPFSLMGGSAFLAALLLLWLPETADKATAETLETDDEKGKNGYLLQKISDDVNSGDDKLKYIEGETIKDPDSGGLLSYV